MRSIDAFFDARSIAVFGASESDSMGGVLMRNLLEGGYRGTVVPVNPAHHAVHGLPCVPALDAAGHEVELAVIATPAATVPDIIEQCGRHHVGAAMVCSAGFSERGEAGQALERRLLRRARQHGVRVLGPGCLGLLRPSNRLNACLSRSAALPGHLGLITQSGAICTSILDWAEPRQVGFSAVASLGARADVGFGELLDYLALDARTRAILLYVVDIRWPRRFISGLRAAARLKPVIVLKAGRHRTGDATTASHPEALVGSDEVFDTALRRAGAVRVNSIGQLFAAARVLASYRSLGGNRLAVVSNSGAPAIMAADRARECELEVASLGEQSMATLEAALPDRWPGGTPLGVPGAAGPEEYAAAVSVCQADAACDGILVMHAPTAFSDPLAIAERVIELHRANPKPLLTCWLGERLVDAARRRFTETDIPTFATPEAAVDGFAHLAAYHTAQQLLLQTPAAAGDERQPDVDGARLIIHGALSGHRHVLNERESKALLRAFGIPVNLSIPAADAESALIAAESLGFPVAMKIESPDIPHKTDVGGVRLGIERAGQVREAWSDLLRTVRERCPDARIEGVVVQPMIRRPHDRELMVGVFTDPVFGPAITFGAGGTAVEIIGDREVCLPPLNGFLASRMIDGTRISHMLGPFRNMPPVARMAILQVLMRVSDLVCELPEVREIDINPLVVDESGAVAVDARVTVRSAEYRQRYGHLAVHPYPSQYRFESLLADGRRLLIRPVRPEDARRESRFFDGLSERTRYFRFMNAMRELSQDMLVRFTQIDYSREMALVALVETEEGVEQVGVSRYVGDPDFETCEFAVVVSDRFQGQGIGVRLMRHLIAVAHDASFETMVGEILVENEGMLKLAEALGFDITPHPEDGKLRCARLPLRHLA